MRVCTAALLLLVACAKAPGERLLFPDAGPWVDADAGAADAGRLDAGAADAGEADAGPPDAGPPLTPDPPRNLTAEVEPDAGYRLVLRWEPPAREGAAPVDGYVVKVPGFQRYVADRHVVVEVAPLDDFIAEVVAQNGYGQSPPAQVGPVHPGPLGARTVYPGGDSPLVVADFDGDGVPDVLAGSRLFRGRGDGTLEPGRSAAAGVQHRVWAGDVDGDGLADVVTQGLYFQNDAGTLTARAGLPNTPLWAVADFNGDGRPDLATLTPSGTPNTYSLEVRPGGPGGLGPPGPGQTYAKAPYPQGPIHLVAGDFDGDGRMDLLLANLGPYDTGPSDILPGLGDGHFGPAYPVAAGASGLSRGGVVADWNGDGRADFNLGADTTWISAPDGGWAPVATPACKGTLVVADFNGDGRPDLATDRIYLGLPDGGLEQSAGVLPTVGPGSWCPLTATASPLAAGDLDGDGRADLISNERVRLEDGGVAYDALVVRRGR